MSEKSGRSNSPWDQLSTEKIYKNPWFSLRQDQVRTHSGKVITYTYMEHPGAVSIVPVTPAGEIILIKSYRYTVKDWCWEIPMGARDHEDLAVVARKELLEEVGGICQHILHIQKFYANNGVSNICCDVFLAHDVEISQSQHEDAELIEVYKIPKEEVFRMARSGDITDGMSALSLFLCEPYL